MSEKSNFPTWPTILLVVITSLVNAVVTWVVSSTSISLSEEHSLVTALIPILTSDDGVKVQMGLSLLREALPDRADGYEKNYSGPDQGKIL